MRRAIVLFALLALSAVAVPADADSDGGPVDGGTGSVDSGTGPVDGGVPPPVDIFYLLMGFSAQEACSCAFVDGQTDDYCANYGQESGYSTTVTFDHASKTASAAFGSASRTARATDAGGCTLDALP
jgi:hypothetical protein